VSEGEHQQPTTCWQLYRMRGGFVVAVKPVQSDEEDGPAYEWGTVHWFRGGNYMRHGEHQWDLVEYLGAVACESANAEHLSKVATLREQRNDARRHLDRLLEENRELKSQVEKLRDQLRTQDQQSEGERRAYLHMLHLCLEKFSNE